MFTKRKAVKKNVKKNINELECEERKEKLKTTGRVDSWEHFKKKGKNNSPCVQLNRQNVELAGKEKAEEKGETKAEKPRWEKNNKNRKEKDREREKEKEKRRMSYKERKKEDTTNKVNIGKTSFLIYSENDDEEDNDNYITLKKKKRNKRFDNYLNKLAIKEMKREERNISKNEKLKNVSTDEIRNYASKKKETYLLNEPYRDSEAEDHYHPLYNEQYKNKRDTYMDHRENEQDEYECVKKLHEHNFHLNLKDEEEEENVNEEINEEVNEEINKEINEEINEEENENKNEMNTVKETGQKHINEYGENGEYYSFLNMEQAVIGNNEKIMLPTERSVEKKETQNEEEQRQRHQQEQQHHSYNMFMNEENYGSGTYGETVMIHFTDEKEENDEETKQLIEKIKIKKQILRKKNEIQNTFENEFREYMRENVSDEDGNIYVSKKKKLFLSTVDFEKSGIDDDFEVEDIYNYETLEEIKKRLLIKKNTNEETKNVFHDFHTVEEYDSRLLSESENENSFAKRYEADEFFEKEKIENIVNKRVLANAKQERDFYLANRKSRFEETDDENENDEKKESRGISNKAVPPYRTTFSYDPFSEEHTISPKGEPLRKRRETCENEDEINGDRDRDGDGDKKEKYGNDKEPTLSENPPCFGKMEKDGLYCYNKSNEQLFEKIKKTFKDNNVCNLQLVKMKKYIYNLFNEYKSKQDKYSQNENTESKNKEEYRRLAYLCKNRKNDVIICTLFLEFFHNIRNVLLEKGDLVHSALRVLQKMEKTFHLIYQELKIYLYKEFYEKYKLSFTNNYIFHLKYYRSKKERQKQKRLKKLEKKNVLIKNESIDSASDLNEKILEQVDHVELFNNIPLLYLFDGFSSNYSSDSSNSSKTNVRTTNPFAAVSSSPTVPSTVANGVKGKMKNQKEEEKKQRIRKLKYCQTLRMEQLKKRFIAEVNSVCSDVKIYFLNFKNIIKHFYLLKSYNADMYRKWKCAACFEEIFFFFVKWEILHWDPIFQFSVKMNRKRKRMLNYCKKNRDINQYVNNSKLGGNENQQSHLESSSSSNSSEHERIYWRSETDSEKSDDSSFSLVTSDESSGVFSESESEGELEKGEVEKNEGNKGEGDRGKKKRGKLKRGEMKGSETKKKDIKKKDGKDGKDGKNHEKREFTNNKDLFSLFQNTTFRNAEYRFRKRVFDNPSIKSFEWYKFIGSILIVSDVKHENTLLKQLYRKVLNKRIFEIIEIWNPFSLKQSASMFVIIKEFLMYNNSSALGEDVNDVLGDESKTDVMGVSPNGEEEKENWKATEEKEEKEEKKQKEKKEMTMLIQKIKDKMNECQSVILESNVHIDTLKKRNIFLMRCLKFFKCFKNILYMLKNNELSEIVKKIYCDFVLTNYVNSVKFHNFIFVSIIEILLFLDFSDENFVKEITNQYNSIKELM